MRLSRFATVALVLSSMGCLDDLDVPDTKAGFITIDLISTGGDAYAARPFGVFYDETNLRFNRAEPGQCNVVPYFSDDTQFTPGKTMNVGATVAVSLPTGTDELVVAEEFDFTYYRTVTTSGIALTPGDTMTFTIPGGDGFPEATIADATPEPFTFGDVGVPEESAPIPLTWTPATIDGSIINFSLRFADDFSNGEVNRQVSCWFADDGAGEIPATHTDGWIRSQGDIRQVVVTRLRSKIVELSEDVSLTMVSTLAVPTPTL